MFEGNKGNHVYHAEASALAGYLRLPLEREIHPHAEVALPPHGGYQARQEGAFKVESALSYRSAYTQVAGHPDLKSGHGVNTLATAVIEGFNVLDVVTADRIVAQINTDHPPGRCVPRVNFLGTRIENLRIAGRPVKVHLDLHFFGSKPASDAPYSFDSGFKERVERQQQALVGQSQLSVEPLEQYSRFSDEIEGGTAVDCSLAKSVATEDPSFPGRCYGNVIEVPNFGVIHLAKIRLVESHPHPETGNPQRTLFDLTMMDIQMGCVGAGAVAAGNTRTNGMPGQ